MTVKVELATRGTCGCEVWRIVPESVYGFKAPYNEMLRPCLNHLGALGKGK